MARHDPHVARGTSRTCDKHATSDTCPEYFPLIMKQFIVERDLHHLVGSGKCVCERLETCRSRQQCRQVCPEWLFIGDHRTVGILIRSLSPRRRKKQTMWFHLELNDPCVVLPVEMALFTKIGVDRANCWKLRIRLVVPNLILQLLYLSTVGHDWFIIVQFTKSIKV